MTSPFAAAARQSRAELADRNGIDAAFIDRLVEDFYASVRADPMLAPHFAARIGDWAPHLARMKDFWTLILRAEGAFHGNPMLKHIAMPGLGSAEFARWLELFARAARAQAAEPPAAELVIARAQSIAASLLAGIHRHRGIPHPSAGETHHA